MLPSDTFPTVKGRSGAVTAERVNPRKERVLGVYGNPLYCFKIHKCAS